MITPTDFAKIISCTQCSITSPPRLLRDHNENVPQPGFIGPQYMNHRVLLVGQNPGICSPRFEKCDSIYTSALRAVRDCPTDVKLTELTKILIEFVQKWPIHGRYFPLAECNLTLNDIAYINVVRCRTVGNAAPNEKIVGNCLGHFKYWVEALQPNVIIFLGKWAYQHAKHIPDNLEIPCDFINRMRSLSSTERESNRKRVISLSS